MPELRIELDGCDDPEEAARVAADLVGAIKAQKQGGARVCPTCGGKGGKWYLEEDDMPQEEVICPDCDGTGEVRDGDISSNG